MLDSFKLVQPYRILRINNEGVSMKKSFFEMDKTNVMIEFNITGNAFNPEIITQKLLIQPDEFWMKGDKIESKNITRGDTCWTIDTGYKESLDINEQLKKLIDILNPKSSELKELKCIYGLEYRFCIVINIENNEKPVMCINSETIRLADKIGAEIDFDLYIYS